MFLKRQGLIVWIHNVKSARVLERYGSVHYVSRKLRYAVMYVDKDGLEATIAQIEKLNFVKKVELSYRGELKTEYSTNVPSNTSYNPL